MKHWRKNGIVLGQGMKDSPMIDGVKIIPLKQIKDNRGMVMHMMRSDSPWFKGFGEIYFSVVNLGVVKAWKRHKVMTQNFAVPEGIILLVLYDDRHGSSTYGEIQTIEIGINQYYLVQIPPMIWYGFKTNGKGHAIIANCTDVAHEATECEHLDHFATSIPYKWDAY